MNQSLTHLPEEASESPCAKVVLIGVSTGGLKALCAILPALPADFPWPVLIVQHQHPDADDYLAQLLNEQCQIKIKQSDEKERIRPGTGYLAPANYHLLLEEDLTLSLSLDPPVNFSRPAVDVLFESAVDAMGQNCIGIILTGANKDGAKGLAEINHAGGTTVVQNPAQAVATAMPLAAMALITPDHILNLQEIGSWLVEHAKTHKEEI
ncbi:MAG: chemotaxis protein CheB [Magnetococcales bacterium]|nr:chemotaxis protein CheB [Magnetococcales bacterium]